MCVSSRLVKMLTMVEDFQGVLEKYPICTYHDFGELVCLAYIWLCFIVSIFHKKTLSSLIMKWYFLLKHSITDIDHFFKHFLCISKGSNA